MLGLYLSAFGIVLCIGESVLGFIALWRSTGNTDTE